LGPTCPVWALPSDKGVGINRGIGVDLRPAGLCQPDEFTCRDLISRRWRDIIVSVKQLLLRVPEDLHRRIRARAAREGRSMNAVAGAILDASADDDLGSPPTPLTPQERLRARARALGMLSEVPARPVSKAERDRIIASTRGIGPIVDRLIDEDRGRLE
jgi:HicB family